MSGSDLRDDLKLDRELDAATVLITDAIPEVPPPPFLRERLLARVAAYEELKPLAEVRRSEGGWRNAGAPGVEKRLLYHDRVLDRTTTLVRMAPGSCLPEHTHTDDEQCLVLEGDISWGAASYGAGDFLVMGKASHHPEMRTENGNLLLLVAGHNEFSHR